MVQESPTEKADYQLGKCLELLKSGQKYLDQLEENVRVENDGSDDEGLRWDTKDEG